MNERVRRPILHLKLSGAPAEPRDSGAAPPDSALPDSGEPGAAPAPARAPLPTQPSFTQRALFKSQPGKTPSVRSPFPRPAERLFAPAPPPAAAYTWKCRPCGTAFVPPREGPDDEAVRCPACNAKLGKAGDFRLDPPPMERLRARAVKAVPAAATMKPQKKPR